jgi:imidazolonepropionase-like amidohydrolase
VLDLGGDPVELARRAQDGMPLVAYAGAFLTAPSGYPAGRSWASATTVRQVSSASAHPGVMGGAATAVDEQAAFGASVIKVALNADAGPTLEPATLSAIVAAARRHALPVVAHVEGAGMTAVAVEAGTDALAHTPFTEVLDGSLIASAVAIGQRWISTLDIHRDDPESRRIARKNLERFVQEGGAVLYGTDLGNGDLPVGVNERELAALHECGVTGAALLRTLTDPWPRPERSHAIASFVSGDPPADLASIPGWLAGATVVPAEELIDDSEPRDDPA